MQAPLLRVVRVGAGSAWRWHAPTPWNRSAGRGGRRRPWPSPPLLGRLASRPQGRRPGMAAFGAGWLGGSAGMGEADLAARGQGAHAASLASSAVQPVPCRSAWRGPYASPYAARSRTPLGSGRGFVLFMPVVGQLTARNRSLLAPGSGAAALGGALRGMIHRRVRVRCGPAVRAASGNHLKPALVATHGGADLGR
jgi:hypothetical protein